MVITTDTVTIVAIAVGIATDGCTRLKTDQTFASSPLLVKPAHSPAQPPNFAGVLGWGEGGRQAITPTEWFINHQKNIAKPIPPGFRGALRSMPSRLQ